MQLITNQYFKRLTAAVITTLFSRFVNPDELTKTNSLFVFKTIVLFAPVNVRAKNRVQYKRWFQVCCLH